MEVVMHEAANPTEESESVKYNSAEKSVTLMQEEESGTFSRPPQQTIDLQFEDIKYTASLGFRKGTKEILHGVNGKFPPGQLIAIMGPSGAGKSTLLDILSGYRIRGVSGTVYANGFPRNLKAFRKSSCYIQQDDRLQPLLTTAENMQIAADLKLGPEVSQREKTETIEEILKWLGLSKTMNTKAAGLSGGQKKRLSIALELINNPTVMFLDEPTTGLDSSSCSQCIKLLKDLARQGRTIVCTIHQPSASLFQLFDQVYVLAAGRCLYQGSTTNLVPFLNDVKYPCPQYHNPADFVIELACEEYGPEIIDTMVATTENGSSVAYFDKEVVPTLKRPIAGGNSAKTSSDDESGLQATSSYNQLKVLLRRGYIKTKRDQTLTYMRLMVNASVGLMLGTLYWQAGSDGTKVLDNYNLLFSILMHHMMSTMMLTILTFPNEMSILIKEHFNRWYSLKMYYTSVTLVDIPVSIACCALFSTIIYYMTGQPLDKQRFMMFFVISMLVVFVAQSFGLMVGAVFNVINGTFLGPTLSVPMMMFAGFGVTLRDLPGYLYWGSYISYLRYGLEGIVGAIYGLERETIWCPDDAYCHYKYPKKLLEDIAMKGDQFGNDVIALVLILFFLRIVAYVLLRYKLMAVR
ncbi:Protein white-like Protein [Tribolium castaneum]|uniref:Protein white-like Protein n=1 Tax=Tribolium castaneum TaxID=7070 RepID=D2A232_TRICA|nr:PREDICTED: ATP-binding cassette sub-family G member 1 [Tribolium castaneum]EFA02729.1 Protein white-like Protein [Tribolium castaneum]|eukprot:XP_008192849.1 PREDICTED: ATP-binding cassette sub-family G member 1 [Tribolium castaneum]